MGLDGLLRGRAGDLLGILNGLDVDGLGPGDAMPRWPRISAPTTPRRARRTRRRCSARLGLAVDPGALLFGLRRAARLAEGRGPAARARAGADDGRARSSRCSAAASRGWSTRCRGCRRRASAAASARIIGFDEGLARLVYGGADVHAGALALRALRPRAAGALRYGALPVVARTSAGSATRVIDANPMALAAGCATGVQVAPGTRGCCWPRCCAARSRCCAMRRPGARMQANAHGDRCLLGAAPPRATRRCSRGGSRPRHG